MGLERKWVGILDSPTWRKYASSAPMREFFSSRAFKEADVLRRSVMSRLGAHRNSDRYQRLETMCLAVGHTKSGGTLIGALLDAHPAIAMSDELDVLRFVDKGFDVQQIAYLIEKASRREAMKDRVTARRLEPYSFAVSGQFQGSTSGLTVIGDSKAGIATQRLGKDPALLARLIEVAAPLVVKFVHVVRNPFDPIAVMRIRGKRSFDNAVERYFENCQFLDGLRARLSEGALQTVRYESMVIDPETTLRDLGVFLGVDTSDRYLAACSAVIGELRQERTRVEWTDGQVEHVVQRIAHHEFLDGYSFEETGLQR